MRFRWVRGHVGNPFNERADHLAGLAAQDWAAGRGSVDDVLVSSEDAESGAPRPVRQAAPEPAREAVGARSEPGWELGTLFD